MDALPGLGGGAGEAASELGSDIVEGADDFADDPVGTIREGASDVQVAISGGLSSFIDRIERDPNTNI
jgi:hypothetical protein